MTDKMWVIRRKGLASYWFDSPEDGGGWTWTSDLEEAALYGAFEKRKDAEVAYRACYRALKGVEAVRVADLRMTPEEEAQATAMGLPTDILRDGGVIDLPGMIPGGITAPPGPVADDDVADDDQIGNPALHLWEKRADESADEPIETVDGEVVDEKPTTALVPVDLDGEVESFDADADLSELAAAANHWYAEAESHARSAVECAYRAGRALQAAKDQMGHGPFKAWVADNFTGTHRTANRYMQVAQEWTRVSTLGVDTVPSINAVLRAINPPKPSKPPKPKANPVTPKLTKEHRSYLLKELGLMRGFMAEMTRTVKDEPSKRAMATWAELLPEIEAIIEATEVKR